MTNARRNFMVELRDTIRWPGPRQVLDHGRRHRDRDAFTFTMKVNEGTRT